MIDIRQSCVIRLGVLLSVLALGIPPIFAKPPEKAAPLRLVVMDPLAKELACACVKGHGQRDYRKLASKLESVVKQSVSIDFTDDLAESVAAGGGAGEIVVVGVNETVVRGASQAGLKVHPVCELSSLDGSTVFTALFITRAGDTAGELKAIGGRTLFLGQMDAAAKDSAVLSALRNAGVESAVRLEKKPSITDAALDMLDSPMSPTPVAVIPSYALPMIEGCGSVRPGEIKVIGKSGPIPFITVFLSDAIQPDKERRILKALLDIKGDAKLLKIMESRDGFKPLPGKSPGPTQGNQVRDWPDWRGPDRDGHVPSLPEKLPATARPVWKKGAMQGGLAGLSVSGRHLILAERDFSDENDVYRCLDTGTGELLWRIAFPARGKLDYGQAPRATPVIHGDRVYLLGAFGDLRCVKVSNGKLVWKRQLSQEFKAPLPTWGMCSPPLVVDDLLVVNPGATNASLAALDCATGRTRWTVPGPPAAYSAFICGEFGGRRQIVGYDRHSLGGWDVKTGNRLWQLMPPTEGDFNVPTPIAAEGGIIVSTENNGTRHYRFDAEGRLIPTPSASFAKLAPDTSTPVFTCGRVFGFHQALHSLDVRQGLRPVWQRDEPGMGDHVSMIADDNRVLVITIYGELILMDARSEQCRIISRLKLFEDDVEMYSHPALVGTRLYARGGSSIVCMDLGTD